jgi:NADPH:quinone reductase-like Zn-dependent oxidoreductase
LPTAWAWSSACADVHPAASTWLSTSPGAGVLPELIELAGGGPEHVLTVADVEGAQKCEVRFSSGGAGRAVHSLGEIGELVESGWFTLQVAQTFPFADIARAHRVSENGHVRGKLVLLAG